MPERQFWRIEGFDGTIKLFERRISVSLLTRKQAETLLQNLICTTLSASEIIDDTFAKQTGRLTVTGSGGPGRGRFTLQIGSTLHFVASLWSISELVIADARTPFEASIG